MSEARRKQKSIPRPSLETEVRFIEDFRWLSEMIDRDPPAYGDIRRSSAVLRRFFPDTHDFHRIASFWAPKPTLIAFDNRPFYRAADRAEVVPMFVSGGRGFLEHNIVALSVPGPFDGVPMPAAIEERLTQLNVDTWEKQKLICFWGTWASRVDIINYVANRAHGVHSGKDKDKFDESLSMIRRVVQIGRHAEGHPRIAMDPSAPFVVNPDFTPRPNELDCVLFEYACTVRFFVESPDAIALCDLLAAEHKL
jgi:hypothetical protein